MPKGNNGGFTLIELLVVILIIVILSVTMLPLLKPFVTRAQYAAEGVPVISNLRLKVELYRIDKDHLPGLMLVNGKVVDTAQASDTSAQNYTAPKIQSMNDKAEMLEYANGSAPDLVTVCASSDHVFKQIDVSFQDLTGKRLRPSDMQYIVTGNTGEKYLWVIGCFGSGNLAKGCGYAVLEYNNPDTKTKFVATFERYKPSATEQLYFRVATAPNTNETTPGNTCATVWLPDYDTLTTCQFTTGDHAVLDNLQAAGWDVTVALKP